MKAALMNSGFFIKNVPVAAVESSYYVSLDKVLSLPREMKIVVPIDRTNQLALLQKFVILLIHSF